MRPHFILACLALVCWAAPADAQERPQDPLEVRLLLEADEFSGASTGEAGDASGVVLALRAVLARPAPEARRALLDVLERGELGGQLYALCGLYLLDRPLFEEKVKPFLTDEREIAYCASGCTINMERVRDIVRSPSRYAVRLPNNYAGASWAEWVEAQDWPQPAWGRPDIVGGAFPFELGRPSARIAPRGTLAEWVAKLEGGDEDELDSADPEEIGAGIASFGAPALKTVRALASDERAVARQVAAEAVACMGAQQLGPRGEEAAKLVGPLLHDEDPDVRRVAAYAIYELYPWCRSANGEVVRALERLPAERGGEVDFSEFHDYLIDPLGRLVGEAAVPALAALLKSPDGGLRCAAGCALSELGERARAARAALAARAPRSRCALEALVQVGLEPGSAELQRLLDLLQTGDAEQVQEVAFLLAKSGPEVAGVAAERLRQAEARFAGSERVVAELARVRWKVCGETAGLVGRLVAAAGDGQDRYLYGQESLETLLREKPALLAELAPILRGDDAGARRVAWRVAAALEGDARSLAEPLAQAVGQLGPDAPHAAEAALALLAVSGEPGPALRVARRLVDARDRRAHRVLRDLDVHGAPLIDPVLAWAKDDPKVERTAIALLAAAGPGQQARSVPLLEAIAQRGRNQSYSALHGLVRLADKGSKPAEEALERLAAVDPPTAFTISVHEALDRRAAR